MRRESRTPITGAASSGCAMSRACWQAQAGGGVAVVDRAAVAGNTFRDLVVRPFETRERLVVSILRNRYRPLSRVQRAFCSVFDGVWKGAMAE
jgi:hypothetical protein